MCLTTTIKTIQDIMRKDVGVDGDAQRIGQLVWMLFLKILDEREKDWEIDKKYISPLPPGYRWRDWAAPEKDKDQRIGDELISFVNNELFPTLKDPNKLKSKNGLYQVILSVFEDAFNYMKSGVLLRQVVNKIEEGIYFESMKNRQHLGDIYEKILRDLQSAGNAGEFYTPRSVTKFAVDRLAPQLGESILDPACGTGGFLGDSINYIEENHEINTVNDRKKLQNAIYGYEVKSLPHMLAVTNMVMHGIDAPSNIKHKDTLSLYKGWEQKFAIVVTNPPFGGVVQDGTESDFPKDFQTKETADIFLYFIINKMLADDGQCAIVLPDGFLFGEGIKNRLKEKFLNECNLHTVVRLPNGVFNPYTGIKTNVLFFRKGKPTETIWFYEHPYPEGYKNYSKTRPMRFEEFKTERAWWGSEDNDFAKRKETENAWKIDFKREKKDALAKAKPHYKNQAKFEKERDDLNLQIKGLIQDNKEIQRQIKKPKLSKQKRKALEIKVSSNENKIAELREQVAKIERKVKDEKSAGDRIKYAVYNLDSKNPHTTIEQVLDSNKLLQEYKEIQAAITQTQKLLKDELAAALLQRLE